MNGNFEKALSYTGYVITNNTWSVLQTFSPEQICQEIREQIEKQDVVWVVGCLWCNRIWCEVRWRMQMIFPQFCHDSSDNSS